MSSLLYRIGLLLVFTFTSFFCLEAQRNIPKYENLVKDNASKTKIAALASYLDYASLMQNNPNEKIRTVLFFQIAELSSQLLSDSKQLNQAGSLPFYRHTADQNYRFCLTALTDADFKRDRDFYVGVPAIEKRPNIVELKQYINQQLEQIEIVYQQLQAVNQVKKNQQENYLKAYHLYKGLCDQYFQSTDLYQNWTANSLQTLQKINQYYTEVEKGSDQLKLAAVSQHEILQDYEFKNINVFRVDGLTRPNFSDNTSYLWNYGKWADSCIKLYNFNIAPLASQIKTADSLLDRQIEALKLNTFKQSLPTYYFNQTLIPALLEIDPDNTSVSLLLLKQKIANLLSSLRNPLNFAQTTTGPISLQQQASYYEQLMGTYQEFQKAAERTEALYTKKQKNTSAITTLCLAPKKAYIQALANLKYSCFNLDNIYRASKTFDHKKTPVPFYLGHGFYRATAAQWITKAIIPDNKGGYYISGSSINNQGFAVAFTAYSIDGVTLTWCKTTDISKMMYDDAGMALDLHPDGGCFVLISSKNVSDPTVTTQTIVQYSEKGEQMLSISMPEKTLPLGRFIHYLASEKKLLLAFYGQSEDWFESNTKLVVQELSLENQQLMRADLELKGALVDINFNPNGYLLTGNYSEIKFGSDEFKTTNDHSQIFSIHLNTKGEFSNLQTYRFSESSYLTHSIVTQNGLLLLGEYGKARKETWFPYTEQGETILIPIPNK